MRKRTKFKSPVRDFFVVVLTLSVAGYFSWIFWKDLNNSSSRSDKEKIAIITFKNRIAQRKYDDRVVWERIDKSTPLYNGDLIRTAELAEAVITFNDGSEVNIYENTMIQVYYSDFEGVNISVGNGNLQVESADNSKVQLTLKDGSKVSAGGGASIAAKTSAGESGTNTVEVKSGSATLTGSSGTTEDMKAGQSLNVKSSGEIVKNPVTVTSIPAELRILNVEGKEVPVKLEWNKTDKEKPVILQTSKKKDFTKIKEEKIITSANDSLISLSEGTIYWRLFTEGDEEDAAKGKISVEEAKALELISPANEGILQYRNRNPILSFSWIGNEYAKNYLVKVSSTPDMQTPVLTTTVSSTSLQVDSLGGGQWWWQVTPFYELNSIGYASPSKISTFIIEKKDGIAPPLLTVPLQNAEIHYKDSLSVNFSWKSDIKAAYELLIAKDKDFNDVILRRNTAGQRANVSMSLPEKDGQNYFWKVVRNSSDPEDLTPVSDVREFSVYKYVSVPAKLLYPPEEYSTELSKISSTQFMWKPSDEAKAKESLLQVSASKDFTSLQLERKVTGRTLNNVLLPQGEWYWRVGTQDSAGDFEYTQPHHLIIQKDLEAPTITNVAALSEMLIAENSMARFNWRPVEGADYYNVRIFNNENKLVAENPEVKGTSANFKLPDDSYSIKIQAVSSQTESSPLRTGPVQTVDFSVRTPEPLSQLSPAPSAKIEGLTALRTPVNFSWKTGKDKPVSTEFILKKRQADGTLRLVERQNMTKTSYSVSRLTPGSYTWQVNASTKEGLPINSKELSFTITPVNPLETPKLKAPSRGFVMDSKFLRKNRSVSFEWTEVEGATEYSFVIYRKDKNGRLASVYSENKLKTNKLRFKQLSALDLGDFEWNVTAFSYAKDGYEERCSQVAQGSFTVRFEAPKQITTENTGRLYSGE